MVVVLMGMGFGAGASEPGCVREAVTKLKARYPQLQLQDVYKYFFHDAWGPGHLIPSPEGAKRYLRTELAEMAADTVGTHGPCVRETAGEPYFEPSGCGENFYHVSLRVITDSLVDFDTFFQAFYDGMADLRQPTLDEWAKEWQMIEQTVEGMGLDMPGFAADKARIAKTLAKGEYTMHHSLAFEKAYRPHYRLIRKDIFDQRLRPAIEARR